MYNIQCVYVYYLETRLLSLVTCAPALPSNLYTVYGRGG